MNIKKSVRAKFRYRLGVS